MQHDIFPSSDLFSSRLSPPSTPSLGPQNDQKTSDKMTGTTRASYPAALEHDKRTHDPAGEKTLKKGGAGPHNWGSVDDEIRDELDTTAADGDDPVARDEELRDAGIDPSKHPLQAGQSLATDRSESIVIGNRSAGTENAVGAGGGGDTGNREENILQDAPTAVTA